MKRKNKFVKKLGAVAFAGILGLGCVGLVGCDSGDINSPFNTTEDLFGFAALTTGELLSDFTAAEQSAALTANAGEQLGGEGGPTQQSVSQVAPDEATVAELNRYMSMLDGITNGNDLVSNTVGASDREGYQKKQTITVNKMGGREVYEIYFNETAIQDDDDDDDDDLELFEEQEEENLIEGIMVVGEDEFAIRGMTEKEGDEYEMEFRAFIDEQNFIVFEQEIENDEQEFVYKLYKGGRLVDSFSMEYEKEHGETELKLETKSDNITTVYKLEKEKTFNGERITIICKKNGQTSKFYAKAVEGADGAVRYEYFID